jgi:hypothetical protein
MTDTATQIPFVAHLVFDAGDPYPIAHTIGLGSACGIHILEKFAA